jgi:TetR/AcrR family transcriptional regulator, transcriptional repressor for nem operon
VMSTGARMASKARTRDALLDAGLALAEHTGLDGLSVNAVTAAAGVAKGTFFHHFGDRSTYLVALHRRFHDRILDEVQPAVAAVAPGRDRLEIMSTIYLDACLRNRGVRALTLEARGLMAIQDEIAKRNQSIVELLTTDFVALGWPNPRAAARLWLAATVECALVELDLGCPDHSSRSALLDMALRKE